VSTVQRSCAIECRKAMIQPLHFKTFNPYILSVPSSAIMPGQSHE
jgi:hypothetical protein